MSVSAAALELTKENVLPLRGGRKPLELAQVLATPSAQHKADLDAKLRYASRSHPGGE